MHIHIRESIVTAMHVFLMHAIVLRLTGKGRWSSGRGSSCPKEINKAPGREILDLT